MTPDLATPDGCRWCGIGQREHLQRWTSTAKWHQWVEPTDAQRKERMLTRRATATAEKGTTMNGKLTTVFDDQDREWTWEAECWGNDDLMEKFDTLEKLDRRYGPLFDAGGDEVDVRTAADPGATEGTPR